MLEYMGRIPDHVHHGNTTTTCSTQSMYMSCPTQKLVNRSLSLSYQKNSWLAGTTQSSLRALALYSMVNESFDMLESGPTRKKIWQFRFFLFSPPTCPEIAPQTCAFASKKTCLKYQNLTKLINFQF